MASSGRRQEEVTLHVYDIPYFTKMATAVGLSGFHVGVELQNREYSFGSTGVYVYRPKCFGQSSVNSTLSADQRRGHVSETGQYIHQKSVRLGCTRLSGTEIEQALQELRHEWIAGSYDLLQRNCHGFAWAFCQKLGVNADAILAQYCSFTWQSYSSLLSFSSSYSFLPSCRPASREACASDAKDCDDDPVMVIDAVPKLVSVTSLRIMDNPKKVSFKEPEVEPDVESCRSFGDHRDTDSDCSPRTSTLS